MSSALAVIGAGAWGTALAIQAARAGAGPVALVARDPARAAAIAASRENPRLAGARLPDAVRVTTDPEGAAILVLAVPTQQLRAAAGALPAAELLICCAKGMEAGTGRLPLEILAETHHATQSVVLTGPNFAHEIAAGLPAAAVVAGPDPRAREAAIAALATPTFRLYGNEDALGAQLGGAAKNVIAIAAGAVMGAGLGENARAALITRGLAELARLAVSLGGRAETVTGLSGLGDLLLTCTGPASRNYSLGFALGQGRALAEVLAGRSAVTEGVATAPALLARAGTVDLPICRAVAAWLEGRITLAGAIAELLARRMRDE